MLSFTKINKDSIPIAYVSCGEKKDEVIWLTAENIDKVPNEMKEKVKDFENVIDFTTLQKQYKKLYGTTIRLNALDYKIINKCLKENIEPDDPRLQKICSLTRNTMKKDATTSIQVDDGFLMFVPPLKKSFRMYVAGPAGSGKSVMCGKIMGEYARNRPNSKIYVFSDVNQDKALDEYNPTRVLLNNEVVENPITISDIVPSSLVLFDDVDAIPDKKNKKSIVSLQNEILRRGRHPEGFDEGANGHSLTSGTAPSAAYNHFLQSKTETLAGMDNVSIVSWGSPTATPISGAGGPIYVTNFVYDATNFGFSKSYISVNADVRTTGAISIDDLTNSKNIATINFTAVSVAYPITSTSFTNYTVGPALYSVSINRTAGTGVCEIAANITFIVY
eukprot:gene12879-7301_t